MGKIASQMCTNQLILPIQFVQEESYLEICSAPIVTDSRNSCVQLLIAGLGGYHYIDRGIYILECFQRMGTISTRATVITKPGSENFEFGWWKDSTTFHVGIMSMKWCSRVTITPLRTDDYTNTTLVQGEWVQEKPEGWTPIEARELIDKNQAYTAKGIYPAAGEIIDLNEYTTPGLYSMYSGTTDRTINGPDITRLDIWFLRVEILGGMIFQTLTYTASGNGSGRNDDCIYFSS